MARRTIQVSLALAIIDAFTGKPVLQGAKVSLENGMRAIRKSEGYWVFVDLPPASYTVVIEAPYYQKREIQIPVGKEFSLVQTALLPGRQFPFHQPVQWLEGELPTDGPVWLALEEEPPRFRMMESFPSGSQQFSLYFTGSDFSMQYVWIRAKKGKEGLFLLRPVPGKEGEYQSEPPLPWDVDHTCRVFPAIELNGIDRYEIPCLPNVRAFYFIDQDGRLLSRYGTGDE